jgi:hypothetical protein
MISFTFNLLILALMALVCIGIGAAGYRYMLKRNPEKLEAWAQEINAAAENARRKLDGS